MTLQNHLLIKPKFYFRLLITLLLVCPSCSSISADLNRVSEQNILRHVENILSGGPHPAGSKEQRRVGEYIQQELRLCGLEVKTQTFEAVTPIGRRQMTNIWGISKGKKDQTIIISSHYDSKYFKDSSFLGANDSGSSSALLLELARILAKNDLSDFSLWFLFFDGEEAFVEWTSADSLYGSREFVKMLNRQSNLSKISALILMDMIGGKNLRLFPDTNSEELLSDIIWNQAAVMDYSNIFRSTGKVSAQDDHIPFSNVGIPVVDIIDLNYEHWHRQDTVDKLSVENIAIVGNVLLASLPKIAAYLSHKP